MALDGSSHTPAVIDESLVFEMFRDVLMIALIDQLGGEVHLQMSSLDLAERGALNYSVDPITGIFTLTTKRD